MTEPADHAGATAFRERIRPHRRWGRWGEDDQRGAANLIDQQKVLRASGLVRTGEIVSMSRDFPTQPASNNPKPAQHFMNAATEPDGQGSATDFIGVSFHGRTCTHLDALSHVWDKDGAWNGRDPGSFVTYDGVTWGGVEQFAGGLISRGVLFDVAAGRAEGFVTQDEPVTGDELRDLAAADDLQPEPGDILVVHSGREAWEQHMGTPWSTPDSTGAMPRPGLAPSCLDYFHEVDCAMIVWDMMDARPNEFGVKHSVHAIIPSQGVLLLDNAHLSPLAEKCRSGQRRDFMTVVAPLKIVGGTGSPVNPLAVF
ncbi:MAG TPA: cyclase family protein [Nocardioides sp.]|jgi:kynurenine formamidase|uniref:cyclase family protein n=1 Tax=Nocardioides sp. TaxID=35761 RepID=UPI002E37AA75|nr:cyclase family protein [Nocardioides sp.]HEX3931814.1 cyclase family protein [Nocardioides sp.]